MDEKPKVTPKDFFLWAGAMVSLYVSIFTFLALIFNYLNYAFPDQLTYFSGDPYSGGIAYEMASLIVLVPLFLWLMLLIERGIRTDASRGEIWVRRWALYLTLFVAAATIAGDLITLIMHFLQGDVSLRFGLKVLVVFLVAGGGFLHFLADLRGYWVVNRAKCHALAWATGLLVALTIAAGFLIVGTPWQARLYRYDNQKVSDLEQIQMQVTNYWQAHQQLPSSLAQLGDPLSGFTVPVDPQSGQSYEYAIDTSGGSTSFTADFPSFKLCADFNLPTQPYSMYNRSITLQPQAAGLVADSWQHGAGNVCFVRTIDPARYPPLNKQAP